MDRNAGILSVLAILVSAGSFSFLFYQIYFGGLLVANGDETPDKIYYCSSQEEIESAISTIGADIGRIYITDDIILNSRIDINGGGAYVIEGLATCLIKCSGNHKAFNISNVKSCIIKNLVIDGTNIVGPFEDMIYIEEISSNPVLIQNIQLIGDGDGNGIEIQSANVTVENCIITNLYTGIQVSQATRVTISNNFFENIDDTAIYFNYGTFNVIQGNTMRYMDNGITLYRADQNVISNNIIKNINETGILIRSSAWKNVISGNIIQYDDSFSSASYDIYGIGLELSIGSPDSNSVVGNVICDLIVGDSGIGYGIHLNGAGYNTVVGNVLDGNEYPSVYETGGCIGNNITGNVEA